MFPFNQDRTQNLKKCRVSQNDVHGPQYGIQDALAVWNVQEFPPSY